MSGLFLLKKKWEGKDILGEDNMSSTILKKRETIYFTVLIVVFLVGIILGSNSADTSLSQEQLTFKESQLDLQSFSIRFENQEFFGQGNCSASVLSELGDELYESSLRLEQLETLDEIESLNYDYLKKTHNVNQVLFYMKYKEYFEQCEDQREDIILFFFNSSNVQESQAQGTELDKVVDNNGQMFILPMDYRYTDQLSFFYDYYNLSGLPTLVINYQTTLVGITSSQEIEQYLLTNE